MTPKKRRMRVRVVSFYSSDWHELTRQGWLTQYVDYGDRSAWAIRHSLATMTMPAGPRLSDGIPLQVAP